MDHINEHLTTAAINDEYSLAIKAAFVIRKKLLTGTMTKLITLRCSGLQWVISYHILLCTLFSDLLLVLHPCHKLLYFRTAGWEDEWITSAEEIICTQYHQSYGALDTSWVISQETQFSKTKACVFKLLLYIKVLLLVM